MSEYNTRDHWTVKARRIANQKWVVRSYLLLFQKPAAVARVTLTRVAPRRLDDDNLRGALKAVRDAVADWLIPGLAPGRADDKLEWYYEQVQGPAAVIVEVGDGSDREGAEGS